jgi:hypothetical protein
LAGLYQDDDPQDDAGYDQDTDDGEGADPLAELDEDARETALQYAQEQVAKATAAQRQAAQKAGFDLVDGEPVIRDMNTLGTWLGAGSAQSQQAQHNPPAAASSQPGAPADEPEDDSWPDVYADPTAFQKRLDREIAKREQPLLEAMKQQQTMLLQSIADEAVARVPDAVRQHAPIMAPLLEHPDFERVVRENLPSTDAARWRDPQYLAQVAAAVVPMLSAWQPPAQQQQPRTPQGQFASPADAQRRGLAMLSPSRGGGAGPAPPAMDPGAQAIAAMWEMDAAEMQAAKDPSGAALRALWAKRKVKTNAR